MPGLAAVMLPPPAPEAGFLEQQMLGTPVLTDAQVWDFERETGRDYVIRV